MANELTIAQGDDATFELTVRDSGGAVEDLTGRGLRFTVQKKTADKDGTVLIFKSSAVVTEIDIVDAVNGRADIFIDPADTDPTLTPGLEMKPGKHVYDVWLIDTDSSQFQITQATLFTLRERVTVI